jgi:hypothetical protein
LSIVSSILNLLPTSLFLSLSIQQKRNSKGDTYSACTITEQDRVEMSIRQPQSMQNYTELGFKKIKAPEEVWRRIKKFWDENKDRKNWSPESWPRGNTYTNHWQVS